jgi:hypothetical protein
MSRMSSQRVCASGMPKLLIYMVHCNFLEIFPELLRFGTKLIKPLNRHRDGQETALLHPSTPFDS